MCQYLMGLYEKGLFISVLGIKCRSVRVHYDTINDGFFQWSLALVRFARKGLAAE